MKMKYYLRGFGVGIIVATALMILAMGIRDNNSKPVKQATNSSGNVMENIREEESKKAAESTENSEESSSEEATTETQALETSIEMQTETAEATTEVVTQATEPQTEAVTEPATDSLANNGNGDGTAVTEDPSSAAERLANEMAQNGSVLLTISSGMTSNTAADLLESMGVVDSGYDLNMYLYNNGYESKLRVGTYEIPIGASYQDIARIITQG